MFVREALPIVKTAPQLNADINNINMTGFDNSISKSEQKDCLRKQLSNSGTEIPPIFTAECDEAKASMALELVENAAENGHLEAQIEPGSMQDRDEGTHLDSAKAMKHYGMDGVRGHDRTKLANGKMPIRDDNKIFQTDPRSNQGVMAKNLKIFSNEEFRHIIECAVQQQYDIELQENLNQLALGLYWMERSAAQGNCDALMFLGKIYFNGEYSLKKDLPKAAHYFTLAANQDDPRAYLTLGYMHQEGLNFPKNFDEAFKLYRKSALMGNDTAKASLGMMYMSGYGVEKDLSKAIELINESAARGNPFGQFYLGLLYKEGQVVEKDMVKAIEFLSKSGNQGNYEAQFILAGIFSQGLDGVQQNFELAARLLESVASAGNPQAQFNLALFYLNGNGVEKNTQKAIEWARKSADQGHANAKRLLECLMSKN
jgi:TPR repeat protein